MTTLEQAARQALEALQLCANGTDDTMLTRDALAALRQALEQLNQFNPDWATQAVLVEEMQRMAKRIEELETATPQPDLEWVGLTDVEIGDALIDLPVLGNGYFLRIARAIEAKLKEKNT
jgi:hypothetical protein